MSQSSHQLQVFISTYTEGKAGAVHAYQLDVASGQLTLQAHTDHPEKPFFLVLSPDRTILYVAHGSEQADEGRNGYVSAYKIVDDTGQLTFINRQSTQGTTVCYVDVDPSGRTLVAANYRSGSVISFPLGADGAVGKAVSFIQHEGSSINPERQQEAHAHCITITPDGTHAYAADLGMDKLMSYQLDPATAQLSPSTQPYATAKAGSGPRHFVIHPNERHAYTVNELDNSVSMYEYDRSQRSLLEQQWISTVPDTFEGVSHCADIQITPNGRFLYASNRGHDSIAIFEVGDEGKLTRIGIEPSGGEQPQNLAITPDGSLLLCANMSGGCVTTFRIDAETGQMTPVGEPVAMPMPSCIKIR
ncbi:MAG: lactonase family protein [Chloroflexota bacterium]